MWECQKTLLGHIYSVVTQPHRSLEAPTPRSYLAFDIAARQAAQQKCNRRSKEHFIKHKGEAD